MPAFLVEQSQAMRSSDPGVMSYFDYGTRCTTILGAPRDCNQKRYGRLTAPRYDLSRIDTPLALFTGARPLSNRAAAGQTGREPGMHLASWSSCWFPAAFWHVSWQEQRAQLLIMG
jgi:hypothetical protein